jgi:hypothetical protein
MEDYKNTNLSPEERAKDLLLDSAAKNRTIAV